MINAIKCFEVWEGSVSSGYYRISVVFRGLKVDEFVAPTMAQAVNAFENAGYEKIRAIEMDAGEHEAYQPMR